MSNSPPTGNPAGDIIRLLSKVEGSGNRPNQIFEDWLDLTLASFEMIPVHTQSVIETGQMAEDTPEVKELWTRLNKRYDPDHRYGSGKKSKSYFDLFTEAFSILVSSAMPLGSGFNPDILGQIYMEYAYYSTGLGQFFTPWSIAFFMAQMTIMDGEKEVYDRLRQAIAKSPINQIMHLNPDNLPDESLIETAMLFNGNGGLKYFEPITVSDPAVGSGIMLLAAASQYPAWAVQSGLVRFYGQDIDYTCVKMCKVNFMLYGLDQSLIKAAIDLSEAEISRAIPEELQPAYREAKEAGLNGKDGRVKGLAKELRENVGSYQQVGMFEV